MPHQSFFKLAFILASGFFSVRASALVSAPTAKVPTQINSAKLISYVNTFSSMESLLQNYEAIGLISGQDHEDIEAFLKAQKVDLQAALPKIQWSDERALVASVGWKYIQGVGYKTLAGQLVPTDHFKNGFEIYKKMFLALSQQPSVSLLDLWIPQAEAQTDSKRLNSSIGAGSFLLDLSARTGGTVGNILDGALNYSLGGVGEIFWAIRSFIAEGKIECQSGQYVITKGFSTKFKSAYEEQGPAKQCEKFRKEKNWLMSGSSDSLCEFAIKAHIFILNTQGREADRFFVNNAKVMKILKDKRAPACTPELAIKVETELKAEAEQLARKALISAPGKYEPSPGTD